MKQELSDKEYVKFDSGMVIEYNKVREYGTDWNSAVRARNRLKKAFKLQHPSAQEVLDSC